MRTYPKVHHIADPMLDGLLDGPIQVEEKIDGSQFRMHIDFDGHFTFGSRRVDSLDIEHAGMFIKAIEAVNTQMGLIRGKPHALEMDIFAEYLSGPRQNALHYERIPKNSLIIFDVLAGKKWLNHEEKKAYAEDNGFECVPLLWQGDGKLLTPEKIKELLETTSILGKVTIEGIVVKNYSKFFDAGKYSWMEGQWMVGKYVRPEFKELNEKVHKADHSSIDGIKARYNTEARWDKAIQKLRDEDKLQGNMKDMMLLIPEVCADVAEECTDDIKEQLWKVYGRTIIKSSVRGLAEHYNKKLLEKGFNSGEHSQN